jgi:hypothetical protein
MLMGMREQQEPLFNKEQTGRRMHQLVRRFSGDLRSYYVKRGGKTLPLTKLTLRQIHDVVRKIPYRRDIAPVEVVARPKHILDHASLGMDCKKKNILLCAWCRENRVPYRMIASSTRPDRKYHHVFPQALLQGMAGDSRAMGWTSIDATYRNNRIGERKRVTAAMVLKG